MHVDWKRQCMIENSLEKDKDKTLPIAIPDSDVVESDADLCEADVRVSMHHTEVFWKKYLEDVHPSAFPFEKNCYINVQTVD